MNRFSSTGYLNNLFTQTKISVLFFYNYSTLSKICFSDFSNIDCFIHLLFVKGRSCYGSRVNIVVIKSEMNGLFHKTTDDSTRHFVEFDELPFMLYLRLIIILLRYKPHCFPCSKNY